MPIVLLLVLLIAAHTRRWSEAAGTFTPDATLWFAGTPHVGRDAIRRFHETMPPIDPTRVLHIDEIRGRGDMAFVAGHSTVIPAGGVAPVVVGRYLDIRLRQPDGTWLFYRDMVAPVTPQALIVAPLDTTADTAYPRWGFPAEER